MLEDTIEILTKQMIEDNFKNKDSQQRYIITKTDLYKFCIKLVKLLYKESENYERGEQINEE